MNEIVFNLSGASKHRWLPFRIRPFVENSLNWSVLQIQDRSPQSRPVALRNQSQTHSDATSLNSGDRSWICNAPLVLMLKTWTSRLQFCKFAKHRKMPWLQLPDIQESSAVAEMGDRGHNRHGSKRGGGVRYPFRGALGARLIQCGLRRGLLPYQVASSSIQPFGHNSVGCHSPRRNISTV